MGLADDIDERHAVLNAEFDEHLAKIRRGRRVYEAGTTFAAHGFNHSERSEGIDKGRSAFSRRCPLGQNKTRGNVNRAVLRIHRAAGHRHCFSEEGLSC